MWVHDDKEKGSNERSRIMARYQIWNKTDDIYTLSGAHFTAEKWKAQYPWINIPGAKMIITDGMTDEEVLAAIEDFEDNPPSADEPSVEERTAAALEFLAMNSLTNED